MNVTALVLRKAGEYMEQHGKYEGRALGPNGEVCAIGAICAVEQNLAREGFFHYHRALTVLSNFVCGDELGSVCSIPRWSDNTPQEIVVKTFYQLADKIEFEEVQ